jgi:hypothetical protein
MLFDVLNHAINLCDKQVVLSCCADIFPSVGRIHIDSV